MILLDSIHLYPCKGLAGISVKETNIDDFGPEYDRRWMLVDENNSRALLITDSAHALPVEVNRSGLRAIAEGSGDIDRLVIRHLAATTDIRVGDLLVTSGLGGRFPHGYPVARVTNVEIAAGDAFAVVSAAPASALDRGRHVLVVAQSSQFEAAAAP